MPEHVSNWRTTLKCSTITRAGNEVLEKLNVEAYKGIQKAYDRKCEIETRHRERLKEVVEKHNVVNDIMVSPILRRMVAMCNKKHVSERKRESKEMKDASRSYIGTKLTESRC